MAEVLVGREGELKDGDWRIVKSADVEVGVYRHDGRYYAYRNLCHHQGGPVCEGKLMGRVVDILGQNQTLIGQKFDEADPHIVCPWHGYEYRLLTGENAADSRLKLRKHEVVARGGEIYVVI
jgi:nitrite reductase/ring-hydroxylating ferredoxin subunit